MKLHRAACDGLDDLRIALNDWPEVHLRAGIDHAKLQFSSSRDGSKWQPIGPELDATGVKRSALKALRVERNYLNDDAARIQE